MLRKGLLTFAVLTAWLVGSRPAAAQVGVVIYEEQSAFEPDVVVGPSRWFVGFEVELVVPDLEQRLLGTVSFGTFADTIALPSADLDVDVGARILLGWHLSSGAGDLLFQLRGLSADGSELLPAFDVFGEAVLDTHLEVSVLDFDYSSPVLPIDSMWNLRWWAGGRYGEVDFENVAEGFLVGQRARSQFRGVGGHGGVEIDALLGRSGARLIGRIDGAALGGRVRQQFDEVFFLPGLAVIGAGTVQREDRFVPSLGVELGIGWKAPWSAFGLNFAVGYRFERWWNVGDAFESSADLNLHGVFFRAIWNF